MGCPFQGLGQLSRVSTCQGYGLREEDGVFKKSVSLTTYLPVKPEAPRRERVVDRRRGHTLEC